MRIFENIKFTFNFFVTQTPLIRIDLVESCDFKTKTALSPLLWSIDGGGSYDSGDSGTFCWFLMDRCRLFPERSLHLGTEKCHNFAMRRYFSIKVIFLESHINGDVFPKKECASRYFPPDFEVLTNSYWLCRTLYTTLSLGCRWMRGSPKVLVSRKCVVTDCGHCLFFLSPPTHTQPLVSVFRKKEKNQNLCFLSTVDTWDGDDDDNDVSSSSGAEENQWADEVCAVV
jgi:hypothetical protein